MITAFKNPSLLRRHFSTGLNGSLKLEHCFFFFFLEIPSAKKLCKKTSPHFGVCSILKCHFFRLCWNLLIMRPFSLNFDLFRIKKTEYFQLFCEPSQKTNKNAVFCDFVPQCNKFTNKTWLVLTVLMRLLVLLRLHPFRRVIDEKPTAAAARERIQPQTYI